METEKNFLITWKNTRNQEVGDCVLIDYEFIIKEARRKAALAGFCAVSDIVILNVFEY